jgi:hypothetical protein
MAEANEELAVKLTDLTVGGMANMLSTLAAHIVAQTSQQASQQVSEQIAKAVGQLQSDLASRTIIKADTDVGMDERLRATGARENDAWGYKMNTTDFLIGTNNVAHQGVSQNQLNRMMEASVNHYSTILSDERIAKDSVRYYNLGKIQQEQRHADIATENQWESTQESANDALAAELAKSTQMTPAATEHKPS